MTDDRRRITDDGFTLNIAGRRILVAYFKNLLLQIKCCLIHL